MNDYTLLEQLGALTTIIGVLIFVVIVFGGLVLYYGRNIETDSWPSDEE